MLRPGQPPASAVWPGDDDPRAGHFAIGDLAIGSVIPQDDGSWRVRGMATAPEARGRGLGAEVLAALLEHADAHGAEVVWCNARERAVGLYERAGFRVEGEPFELPGIGPHRRMVRKRPT